MDDSVNLQADAAGGLQQSVLYAKDYTVFEKNIFKQTFGMVVKYVNQGETSNVKCDVYVNSKTILRLFDFTYKHCPGANKDKNSDNA